MMSFLVVLLLQICLSNGSPISAGLQKDWWKYAEIYGLNVWTFKDDDGDGFGDLKGLTSKMDYLHELGVTTIELSPIFSSKFQLIPEYGTGDYTRDYDGIDNFTKIHSAIGTLDDFDNLIEMAKSKGIRVILDLPINFCSCNHVWFKKSREYEAPYSDYFIWKHGYRSDTDRYWQYNSVREELYFHTGGTGADLNFRNAAVREEVKKIIKFWFDRGVSGFNLLSANFYVKSATIRREYYPNDEMLKDLPESYEVVHELREYVDAYNKENGGYERILIVEKNENVMFNNLRGNETYPIAHIVTNNFFVHYRPDQSRNYIRYYTSSFQQQVAQHVTNELENGPTLFILEDEHTNARLANRMIYRETFDVWILFTYMCPGTLHIYYGQEIGLYDWQIQYDFENLFPYGASMQWDNSINAGFTTNENTKIPPNSDYWRINAETFKNTPFSTYHMVRDLLKVRKTAAGKYGDFHTKVVSEWIYTFTRSYRDMETYLTVLNLENVINTIDLKSILRDLPEKVWVVASTPNSLHRNGNELNTTTTTVLTPLSGVVIAVNRIGEEIL